MIRAIAIFSVAAVLLAGLGIPLMALKPGAFVVGGCHRIGAGELMEEDMSFFFAQVTVDEGASVDGHIFLFSSTLDLHGNVTEDIHAFESDLTLRESAQVRGEVDETDFINWTLLLPAVAQIP
jgi:hypothetical protein